MGEKTAIEWTDATWNPTTGCTQISDGCANCYALALANGRLADVYRRKPPVIQDAAHEEDPFAVRLWPERLSQPKRWIEPRMIFVNSMSDLFHNHVPVDYLIKIFEVMLRVDWHFYQVLTKRPERAVRFFHAHPALFPGGEIPPHIWMGTSVESQDVVHRVDTLRRLPAAVRFLSCEPLLGELQLNLAGIHWVIVGGESGHGFRPMTEEWAVGVQKQCTAAQVPFFFKQWGGRTPKAGGRTLQGEFWSQMPAAAERLLPTG